MNSITRKKTEKHGMYGTPEYIAWMNMRRRVMPNHPQHLDYFDRGITVCKEWEESFIVFYNDMGKRPFEDYSIDRINNDGS